MVSRNEATAIIEKHLGIRGRIVYGSKVNYDRKYPDHIVVYNANIFAEGFTPAKLWYGDIDITNDSQKLMWAADEIGTALYVLREMDGRFKNESTPNFKKVAVWNTDM